MQGVIKSYDPGTKEGTLVRDTDRSEYELAADAITGSVFRMLRQGQRVVFDLAPDGRATHLRLGSEVDMGTPGFPARVDEEREDLMASTTNQKLLDWVDEVAALCTPDRVEWCDGSQEEYDRLCQLLVEGGTLTRSTPRSGLAATGPPPTPATSPGWRTAPTSAPSRRSTPAPPTTGVTRRR